MPGAAVLYVQDLGRMRAFYTGCFGLTCAAEANAFVVLASGDWELTLVAVPEAIARQNPLSDPPIRRERVPVKLAFAIASIEAGRPIIEDLGGSSGAPADEWEFRGTRRCDATDPEGNVIQLVEAGCPGF